MSLESADQHTEEDEGDDEEEEYEEESGEEDSGAEQGSDQDSEGDQNMTVGLTPQQQELLQIVSAVFKIAELVF
jgi:ABC-type Zn2+ transport system substrate-binding protein/surface adhesin